MKQMLWCGLLLFISVTTYQVDAAEKVNIKNINQVCEKSPNTCLTLVDDALRIQKPKSHLWYELHRIKLDHLFLLSKNAALYEQTQFWVKQERVPHYLKLKVFVYHTKMLSLYATKAKRDEFRSIVEVQLNTLAYDLSEPELLLDLVNLQLYSEKPARVPYNILRKMERDFSQRKDPKFKFELYTNLGHFALRLGLHDDLMLAREQALFWAKKAENTLYIGEAYFSLARSFEIKQQYKQAFDNYVTSIEYADLAHDLIGVALGQIHIANMFYLNGEREKAKTWLDKVHHSDIPNSRHELLKTLVQSLK